jgi:MFS family permease
MSAPTIDRMSSQEKRAGISLAAVFALRMLGLFLILPVFAIYAQDLPSGHDVALVGMALGAYGLTQAFLQIAYGAASDRFGRKPVIVFGLILFAVGSFVAASAGDIYGVIAGRVLQGAGAISAAVTALAADLTREQHLTKVMAMIGSSIGMVFAVSMVAAPLLFVSIGMPGIFSADRRPGPAGDFRRSQGGPRRRRPCRAGRPGRALSKCSPIGSCCA